MASGEKTKCADCLRGSGFDTCSRVVCPMRKPITAQAVGSAYNVRSNVTDGYIVNGGGYRKLPTNKE